MKNDIVKMNICIPCVFILFISSSYGGFFNSWKKIKEFASRAHKTKNKALNFLGYDKSEYPGANEEYLKINEDKWTEYYECLRDQNDHLGKYETMAPEAILGFEGNNIKMECKICISPLKRKSMESITWEWAPLNKNRFEPIEISENTIVSPEDQTLHLYNLELENTGQYMCSMGDTLTTPYFLTVINALDKEMREVHSTEGMVGPYPQNPEDIHNQNLVLDTEWSQWSPCSKCNQVGRRHKLGYCSVYMKKFEEPDLTDVQNGTITQTILDEDLLLIDLELFVIFKYGIPCHSHILPQHYRNLPEVQQRKNEIMIGFCKQKCPENLVYEVRDKLGHIVETANNSGGIYSMSQPLPPLEPPIHRKLQYGTKGKNVILQCPGNLNSDTPIQWQVGDKNLIAELVSKESKGRIFISITDRVHINKARVSDSNIYSCWQQKDLAGTVRLLVEKTLEMNFVQHIMLFAIVVILAVFLWVFAKAFMGRKYAKT